MKKYYGYFIYNNEEYVIRFKISGSLRWSEKDRAFIDKDYYVRSALDMISYAATDSHWINDKVYSSVAFLMSHDQFKSYRARGVKRWKPANETIIWD